MQANDITYPPTVGPIVHGLRDHLDGVTVTPKRTVNPTELMVTVRDDGGTGRDGVSRRRHGFNVWANTPVGAQNLAVSVADYCRSVLRAVEVSDPIDVTDETDETTLVGGKSLTHYFLSAVIPVRALNL
ncbi:hypothetical protein NS183_07765 [Microbacterium testaceum]|uniref:hypothetical protein n=1 Tax=Microbacterium testaceum TaxID=2033 RepID=UPI000734D7AC|nr:hypothetical protein [Microbacterium testaceum]KTS90674.1 hypothetical protein NS183_07765 [Microbacterium testaceum]